MGKLKHSLLLKHTVFLTDVNIFSWVHCVWFLEKDKQTTTHCMVSFHCPYNLLKRKADNAP